MREECSDREVLNDLFIASDYLDIPENKWS